MKQLLTVLPLLIALCTTAQPKKIDTAAFHYIRASDLGAFPDDSTDDYEALQQGIDSCLKTKGLFLLLDQGNYINSKRLMIDWTKNAFRKNDSTQVPARFLSVIGVFIIEDKPGKGVGILYTGKDDE